VGLFLVLRKVAVWMGEREREREREREINFEFLSDVGRV
jgi:hypothetical protein